MISFNNVSMRYENGTLALDEVSFFINKGEFVFIVGSSGAGKSTITKLITCEEKPFKGSIIINGINVGEITKKELPYFRRGLGMVFQDFRLLLNKTVYDNVAFAMQARGAPINEIRRTVPSVLSMVGLSHKARIRPGELSGGEQQRVSLARAIVNNPAVLIADEPTGNLDPATSLEIMDILNDINHRGTTVVMITHAMDIVDKMKKRVIALNLGNVVRDEERGSYAFDD